jgi:hypothetical protein
MEAERWGTLSVKDHLDAQALIADLLLYDRLVFPVFSGPGERTRWRGEQWDPGLQENLIEDLGVDVTVKAHWDEARRERYKDLREARKQIGEDAFQTTRFVLAMDQDLPRPVGAEVRVIAAYHDLDQGKQELGLTTPQPDEIALGKLAFVIGQRLLVPLINPKTDPRDLVLRARDLSRERKYREQRQEFYIWQENNVDAIVRGRKTIDRAVEELKQRADQLNGSIMDYFAQNWESLTTKTVLTVVGVGLPFALGIQEAALLGFVPGAFELVKFGAVEVLEPMAKEKCEAAAMLVSARKRLGRRRQGRAQQNPA